jgi:hypothetical protein
VWSTDTTAGAEYGDYVTISTAGVSPGSWESRTVTGLTYGATYYFRIWTADEVPNWSGECVPGATTWAQNKIPPAAITNLSALPGADGGEIDLTWTAPGDDGTKWTITDGEYRIQYSTWTNWDAIVWSTDTTAGSEYGDYVTISTAGVTPGDWESRTVTGLTYGATYYFRIWTADEVPNWSGECIPGATAWAPVVVSVMSASLINSTTVRVYYDSGVDISAETITNYSFNPSIAGTATSAERRDNDEAVELILDAPVEDGIEYTITVSDVGRLSSENTTAAFMGVYPTPEFMDDFNRPNNSMLEIEMPEGVWDSSDVPVGNSISLSTTARVGAYSLRADENSATEETSCLVEYLTPRSTYYVRFYVYLPGGFWAGLNDGEGVFVVALITESGRRLLVSVNKSAGVPNMFFQGDAPDWHGSYDAGFGPQEKIWYCMEILASSGTSSTHFRWWVDGNELSSFDDDDMAGAGAWEELRVGAVEQGVVAATTEVYIDEVVVSSYAYIGTVDLGPPAAITNLSALTGIDGGGVDLTWTAPGDDGLDGILNGATYRIQYSTWTNWDAIVWSTDTTVGAEYGDYVTISTAGVAPGDRESLTVTGLTGRVTYYFRIWTADEIPKWSGISNGATAWASILLGVYISTDTYDFWRVPLAGSSITATPIIVTNAGNIIETFEIKCTTVTPEESPWVPSDNTGNDKFLLHSAFHPDMPSADDFLTNDNTTYNYTVACTESKFTIDNTVNGKDVPISEGCTIWYHLNMPLTSSTTRQQAIMVIIYAVEP